jgi:hypothetical protein
MVAPLHHKSHYPEPQADPAEPAVETVLISGELRSRDIRDFAKKIRSGNIGPTSVYYAGVTAPAIAAGMASVVSGSLERAGWSNYWVLMCSSLLAAMAGITWYLIFMRWSYRHGFGRATESSIRTDLQADELGIFWTRGSVKTRITWDGVMGIERAGKFIRIIVRDSEDLIIPSRWFVNGKAKRDTFDKLKDLHVRFQENQ